MTDQPFVFTNDDALNAEDPLGDDPPIIRTTTELKEYHAESVEIDSQVENIELTVQEQTQQTVTNYANRAANELQECEENPNLKICANKVPGGQTIDQNLGICEGWEAAGGAVGFAGSWELFSGGLSTVPESGGWSLIPAAVGFIGMGVSSLGLFGARNEGPLACNGKG